MSAKKSPVKNTVPKVKLSAEAEAKDAARAAELKADKKRERENAREAMKKSGGSRKYSTQVEAAIKNFINAPVVSHEPWTEIKEKQTDIGIHEKRIVELRQQLGATQSLLAMYEKNLAILKTELAALETPVKKASAKKAVTAKKSTPKTSKK
jgi:hypothetical protein